ncbi:hypothetical protein ACLM5J_18060 [Nocardioides sp. Bht2]|uniref:hypothetical protein n=1 Tax=Nocardioides sp. Bht2 TaxID=3392297 RepID=UPI0039B59677
MADRGVTRERLIGWLLPAGLAFVILGPLLLGRGYALLGDMVFVPDQPWNDRWLGLDGSVPRAVPTDAVTWLLGLMLPGDLVQKLLLFAILLLAGAGAARLTHGYSAWARASAVVLCMWNPYVYERLAIGQWALLAGYAALPWVAHLGLRMAAGERRAGGLLLVPLAAAAWTSPTGGVLALGVLMAVLAPRLRLLATGAALGVLVNLPWLVPGFLNGSDLAPDPFGVSAFAARADTPWGELGSLATLGGIWKSSVVPMERGSALLTGIALVLTLAAFAALVLLVRSDPRRFGGLLAVGLVGLLIAVTPTVAPGRDAIVWLVDNVPGAGLLRDSQKWVALMVPGLVLGLAHGLDRIAEVGRERPGRWLRPIAALLPICLLPSLAWGLLAKLEPHDYPQDWFAARTLLTEAGAADDRSVVLPFGLYRRFDWNGGHAVLDPAWRFFPGEVITDDLLEVPDGAVAGEDGVAAEIRAAADDPRRLDEVLSEHGVRWVIVHLDAGESQVPLPSGTRLFSGERLAVIDRGAEYRAPEADSRDLLLALDLGVMIVTLAGIALTMVGGRVDREVGSQSQSRKADGGNP